MKKTLLFIITTIFIISCNVNNNQKVKTETTEPIDSESVKKSEVTINPITSLWVNYLTLNPNALNNEVTRDKAAKEIESIIIDKISKDLSILQSVPFKYFTSLPKGNKYIIKFTVMSSNSSNIDTKIGGVEYSVGFELFTIVDENFLNNLNEKKYYRVKSCKFHGSVNNKISLPSGGSFSQESSIFVEDFSRHRISLFMVGLYVTDLELEEF